jgi:hypothetical protein
MTDLAPRPRSATELVDAAFQIYRRQPTQFIVAAGIVYVPWLVIRLTLGIGVNMNATSIRDLLFIAAGTVVIYVLVGGVVTRLANDVYLGRPVSVGDALRQVGTRFAELLAAALLRLSVLFLGLLALGVGILYPLARYFAVIQAMMLEGKGVAAAFSRSTALSKNLKGHILGTLILLYIINFAVTVGVAFVVGIFGNQVIDQVVATVMSVFVYPLFGIGETLLYIDARIRNEGYDVELLAAAPPVDPSAGPLL